MVDTLKILKTDQYLITKVQTLSGLRAMPTRQALVQEDAELASPFSIIRDSAQEESLPSEEGAEVSLIRSGNISRYLQNWTNITSNSFILNIIRDGYKIQFIDNPILPESVISNPKSSDKISALKVEIDKYLQSKAISKITKCPSQLLSRVFTVKKANGNNRMIIDLSLINKQIMDVHFKMDTHDTIKDILSPGDYMASIDLTDAFFSVPIHVDSKKYLCFELESQRYQFNVLPFGMKSSPRIFTKVLKPAINFLRDQGIKILAYLDDIFLCASSFHMLESQIHMTLKLLIDLGFHPNSQKSLILPCSFKRNQTLGFYLEHRSDETFPASRKIRQSQKTCQLHNIK